MPNPEIAAVYLELASECFHRSERGDDDAAADAMRRMGCRYAAIAITLDPALNEVASEAALRSPLE